MRLPADPDRWPRHQRTSSDRQPVSEPPSAYADRTDAYRPARRGACRLDDRLRTPRPHPDAVLAEVHRANMSKVEPDGTVLRREDGKVLKGSAFRAADVDAALGLVSNERHGGGQ